MSEANVLIGHGLREKRIPPPDQRGYWLAWSCACGVQFGNTGDDVTRAVARELHRVHKAFMSEPPVGTFILKAPERRWWRRRKESA